MKKIVLINMLLYIVMFSMAQNAVTHSYEYDSAGNRVRRTTITLRQAVANDADTVFSAMSDSKQESHYLETIGEHSINIYPNPTKGIVILQFENSVSKGSYRVMDLSGKMISEGDISSLHVTLDLSPYKNGIYLLTLTLDGKTEIWKIIKQ